MAWRLVDSILGAVIPSCCVLCGQRCPGGVACTGCYADLPWLEQVCARCGDPCPRLAPGTSCGQCTETLRGFDRAWSALAYEYPVDRLITAAKFGRQLALAGALGELLAVRASDLEPCRRPAGELVVPVPLHWRRHGERGFNQAEEIARPVSRALGLPLAARLCRRVRPTSQQTALSAAGRRQNLRGAFVVRRRLEGVRVIIIDDVLTTGATAEALAAAFRSAGVARLEFWSVARAVLRQPATRNV